MLRYSDDLIINGVNITQYLTDCKFGYNKVWGKDTGRNVLSGKYTGTLIGIFPKFICTFGSLTQAQIETLVPILDSAFQTTEYYDPYKQQKISIQTYTGDYELEQTCLFSDVAKAGKPFNISFIATTKRS